VRASAKRDETRDSTGEAAYPGRLAAFVALALVSVFLGDVIFDRAPIDASLYVLPVVMTLWLPREWSTVVVTLVAIGLGGIAIGWEAEETQNTVGALTLGFLETAAIVAAAVAVVVRKRGERRAVARFREWRGFADESPVLMRGTGADGRTIYVSRGWCDLVRRSREQLLGGALVDVAAEGRADLSRAIDAVVSTRAVTEAEYAIEVVGRGTVWVFERFTPRVDGTGKLLGLLGSAIDVTERHAALRTLSENRERLAEAEQIAELGHVDFVLSAGRPVWSDGLYRLLGLEPQSVRASVGLFLAHVVPEERESLRAALEESAATGLWSGRQVRVQRSDGVIRELKVCARLVNGPDGKPVRVFGTLQDITERLVMERALLEHESNLARAQQIASLGSWSMDISAGKSLWSEQMFRLFDIPVGAALPTVGEFTARVVHPDDREKFLAGWHAARASEQPTADEYRIVRSDGSIRVIRAQCEFVRDADGRLLRIIGTCQDVTDMRLAEAALRTSEERFDLAARGANDGIWDWPDVNEDKLWISSRYFELLGFGDGEFDPCGKQFNENLVHSDDVQRNIDAVARSLETREPYDIEIRLRHENGSYRWFRMRGQATYAADGRPQRMAGSTQDVHARKQAEQQIEIYQEQLRSLAYGAALAAERERRRIGVELHDRTIQSLGLTRVKLAQLRERVDFEGSAALFDDIYDLVKETIRDTRSLLAEISPPVLYELGFEAAVEWLAEQVGTGPGGPPCTLHSDGLPKPLCEGAQVVLFQAARELLANVGKHARASHASLTVARDGEMLTVEVADDGIGFDPTAVKPPHVEHGGFGLFSIRERLRLLGGVMIIDSAPGRGARVRLTAPLERTDGEPRYDA
jgi:PAS domain S-box-containing protein